MDQVLPQCSMVPYHCWMPCTHPLQTTLQVGLCCTWLQSICSHKLIQYRSELTLNYLPFPDPANWNGFHDPESDLYAYTWCVGTSLQSCDFIPPRDPHEHLNSRQYWTNLGLETSLQLSNGSYYVTIQAVSAVEYGGPLVTTVHHSTPYIVDVTPPYLTGVQVLAYNTSSNRLLLAYSSRYRSCVYCWLYNYHEAQVAELCFSQRTY